MIEKQVITLKDAVERTFSWIWKHYFFRMDKGYAKVNKKTLGKAMYWAFGASPDTWASKFDEDQNDPLYNYRKKTLAQKKRVRRVRKKDKGT